MVAGPIAMCELLVGLGDVNVLEVADIGDRLRVTIETRRVRLTCPACKASPVVVKDRDMVELTDCRVSGSQSCWRGGSRDCAVRWGTGR